MLSFRLSDEVGLSGKSAVLPEGGSCACAAPTVSVATKTMTVKLFRLIWSLRLEPLNVAHLLRATRECVSDLAYISRTEVGEIETRGTDRRVRGGRRWWARWAGQAAGLQQRCDQG